MTDPVVTRNIVLVVDDERDVRRTATLALSQAGYRAEVAEDGKAGLECFIKYRREICLVLTDAVMPVMNGLKMVEKILELDPGMKILFMTGYSEAELNVLTRTNFALIRKPFLPVDLRRTIAEMIAPRGATQTSQG